MMTTRKAEQRDFPQILALQEENLVTNLSEEQKVDGFVTTPFRPDHLEDLVGQEGIFVLERLGKVRGYAMGASWDFFSQWPIFPFMIARLESKKIQGLPITPTASFQYGPVCVAHELRGTDALPMLFATVKSALRDRYPIGATFINKKNGRSFVAHLRLGLEVVDEFPFNGNEYFSLAFLTGQ